MIQVEARSARMLIRSLLSFNVNKKLNAIEVDLKKMSESVKKLSTSQNILHAHQILLEVVCEWEVRLRGMLKLLNKKRELPIRHILPILILEDLHAYLLRIINGGDTIKNCHFFKRKDGRALTFDELRVMSQSHERYLLGMGEPLSAFDLEDLEYAIQNEIKPFVRRTSNVIVGFTAGFEKARRTVVK